jgi:hypothetical protein
MPGREALWVALALFGFALLRAAADTHPALREALARLLP